MTSAIHKQNRQTPAFDNIFPTWDNCTSQAFAIASSQRSGLASPKNVEGAKMFDFRRATAFVWDVAPQNTKW